VISTLFEEVLQAHGGLVRRKQLQTAHAHLKQGGARHDCFPLLDRLARGVPDDARVVAILVQLEHVRDDALDSLLAVDDAREVLEVML
jgi:DNA invertase Pin-like site-specific DNA recombinase